MKKEYEASAQKASLHHPQQGAGNEIDPPSTSSSVGPHKGGTAVFQAGWHGAGPNPLNALDESAYFPNLYEGKTSQSLAHTRQPQKEWSNRENDYTLAYLENEDEFSDGQEE